MISLAPSHRRRRPHLGRQRVHRRVQPRGRVRREADGRHVGRLAEHEVAVPQPGQRPPPPRAQGGAAAAPVQGEQAARQSEHVAGGGRGDLVPPVQGQRDAAAGVGDAGDGGGGVDGGAAGGGVGLADEGGVG